MSDLPKMMMPAQISSIFPKYSPPLSPNKRIKRIKEKQAPGDNPNIISSIVGRIETLLVTYPIDSTKTCPYDHYLELFDMMDDGERVYCLVTFETEGNSLGVLNNFLAKLRSTYGADRIFPIQMDTNHKLDFWARDSFITVTYDTELGPTTYLVEPHKDSKTPMLPNILGFAMARSNNPLIAINAPFYFEGGNILVGKDFILIGANTIYWNDKYWVNQTALTQRLKEWFGNKELVFISSKRIEHSTENNPNIDFNQTILNIKNQYRTYDSDQAINHIDIFITLGGKDQETGKDILVIGEPCKSFDYPSDLNMELQKYIDQIIAKTTTSIENIILNLKEAAIDFIIKRIPLPLVYHDHLDERNWLWASYNNAILESSADGNHSKKIWLPSYGQQSDYSSCSRAGIACGNWTQTMKPFDESVSNFWKFVMKFDKVTLLKKDYHPFIDSSGSLHCITNHLKRT